MAKLPSIQFYPGDWLRDAVSGCSLAAQGLWLRLMMIAHDSNPYGHLAMNGKPIPHESLALRVGTSPEQFAALLDELSRAGVPEFTTDGIMFSRRMVRDHKQREASRRFGKSGGNPILKHPPNPGVMGGVNPPLKVKMKMKKDSSGKEGPGERVEFFDLIPPSLRVPKFLAAWESWIRHREQRRPKYTAESASRALPKLEAEGVDAAAERIDRSIGNGWQGLFFPGESKPGDAKPAAPNGSSKSHRFDRNTSEIDEGLKMFEQEHEDETARSR